MQGGPGADEQPCVMVLDMPNLVTLDTTLLPSPRSWLPSLRHLVRSEAGCIQCGGQLAPAAASRLRSLATNASLGSSKLKTALQCCNNTLLQVLRIYDQGPICTNQPASISNVAIVYVKVVNISHCALHDLQPFMAAQRGLQLLEKSLGIELLRLHLARSFERALRQLSDLQCPMMQISRVILAESRRGTTAAHVSSCRCSCGARAYCALMEVGAR